MASNSVKALELSTFDAAALTSSYQSMNAPGLAEACFMIRIVNNSNVAITVSYDGITDNEYVAPTSPAKLGFQQNAQPAAYVALLPKFTQVYVKGTAGTGTIALSGYYV
jgi:hypothetical protein